ncbi:MAG: hypothetical protein D6B25_12580 [Desulfobulbaceae bacterium]|nr:MAG: hypothetical protein D6B25_12580 [Desulfobulbaceae bacterium]
MSPGSPLPTTDRQNNLFLDSYKTTLHVSLATSDTEALDHFSIKLVILQELALLDRIEIIGMIFAQPG